MKIRRLKTASDVINAFGGPQPTAQLTCTPQKPRDSRHVCNWRKANKFPADTFLVCQTELRRLGFEAPPSIWGMAVPARAMRAAS